MTSRAWDRTKEPSRGGAAIGATSADWGLDIPAGGLARGSVDDEPPSRRALSLRAVLLTQRISSSSTYLFKVSYVVV